MGCAQEVASWRSFLSLVRELQAGCCRTETSARDCKGVVGPEGLNVATEAAVGGAVIERMQRREAAAVMLREETVRLWSVEQRDVVVV